MGQKDLYQSDFYEDKDRFADVFNGVLFQGKQVMKGEDLEAADSVITGPEYGKGKKVICDKIRRWKGRYVSILVVESQSYVDYRMVLRVMEAEVMGYEKQRKEQYLASKSQGYLYQGDEYLSQMKKDQKLVPIITLVLYLGKERLWDGARSLHEMLELEEAVRPYVNDFKLNLFDYHDCEDYSRFKTANRLLFEMLSGARDKEKMAEILKTHTEDGQVDEESAKAILGMLNVKIDLKSIMKTDEKGKRVYNMCKAFEDYKEEGRQEGRMEGLQEGKKEGLREGRQEGELFTLKSNIENLMESLKVSFEEAAKLLGISAEKQSRVRQMKL